MQTRGMGWLRDLPDIRDYTPEHDAIVALISKLSKKIAKESDLRSFMSSIKDQKSLGSCTANAVSAPIEYFERKAMGHHIDVSRLFIYKVERNLLGMKGDTGAYLRTGVQAAAEFGAPPESYWPYDGSDAKKNKHFDKEPTAFIYAMAANWKALKYYRHDPAGQATTTTLDSIRQHLSMGFPSVFGLPVYDEFMNCSSDKVIPLPKKSSQLYGGHAICAAGHDDKKNALIIRNSWGTGWGDKGYAYLSYDYILKGLAVDWWSILQQAWVDADAFAVTDADPG